MGLEPQDGLDGLGRRHVLGRLADVLECVFGDGPTGRRPWPTRDTRAGIRVWVSLSPSVSPTTVRPASMALTSTETSEPNGGAPTITRVPRAARASTPCRSTAVLPVVSTTPYHAGSAGELSDDLGQAARASFDGVGRAEFTGQFEPLSDPVDGNDAGGRGHRGGHDRRKPHRACPEDGQRASRPWREHIPDRSHPGLHAAAHGATSASGTPGSTLTTLRTSTMARSENDDCPKKCPPSGCPSRRTVALPSGRFPPIRLAGSQVAQYAGCPSRQLAHAPQDVKDRMA